MSQPPVSRSLALPVAGVLAVLFLVTSLAALYASTGADTLLDQDVDRQRFLGFLPYAVVAVGLLTAGLVFRRWWQSPFAPVIVAVGGWAWLSWIVDLPQYIADHDLTAAEAVDLSAAVGSAWHVAALVTVVVGWGLIRRTGGWWLLGLVPTVVLVAVSEIVRRTTLDDVPEPQDSATSYLDVISADLRLDGTITTVADLVVVVACAWACVACERLVRTPATTAVPPEAWRASPSARPGDDI